MDAFHTLFIKPAEITGAGRLGMLVPLTLAVSIVYKTIRCQRLSSVPRASVTLCCLILITMLLIGAVLQVLYDVLA